MSGIVDRRNLSFVLYEVLDLARLLEADRYGSYDREAIEAIFDVTQQIAENEFLPCAAALDAAEPRFVEGRAIVLGAVGEALAACGEAGLFAAGFDQEVGGLQLPMTITTMINGMLAAANIGIANYQFLTIANAHMLEASGSDELKRRFLPPMLAGRWLGTMCLSEPHAGSSLADIRTLAEPIEGRLHRITGSKMWISGGDHELTVNRRPKRTPYRRAKGTPFVKQRDGYGGRTVRAGCGVGRA